MFASGPEAIQPNTPVTKGAVHAGARLFDWLFVSESKGNIKQHFSIQSEETRVEGWKVVFDTKKCAKQKNNSVG